MDLRRLRAGEWIAALSGVALLVSLFLPWYQSGGTHFSGWESFTVLDAVLGVIALFALVVWVVTATQRTVAIAIAMDAVLVLLGTVATVTVGVRVLNLPELGPDVGRSAALYLALAGALGTLAGGWVAMRDEPRTRPGEAVDATGRPVPPQPEQDPLPPPEPAR